MGVARTRCRWTNAIRVPLLLGLVVVFGGCEASDPASGDETPGTPGGTVSFTVYVDAACTELPPRDSVVVLDTAVACNETPDSSISALVCYADRITYLNHPNTSDCSADGIENELPIGVCTEFPGPVPTWKLIDAETYDCGA